jgi:hypothetical protein
MIQFKVSLCMPRTNRRNFTKFGMKIVITESTLYSHCKANTSRSSANRSIVWVNCCWTSSAHSFLVQRSAGLMAIFFCPMSLGVLTLLSSFSYSRNFTFFMQQEGSLPYSQELPTATCPAPHESNPHRRTLLQYFNIHFSFLKIFLLKFCKHF